MVDLKPGTGNQEPKGGLSCVIVSVPVSMLARIAATRGASQVRIAEGESHPRWRRRELNPGHCGYEPHALTTELRRLQMNNIYHKTAAPAIALASLPSLSL